MNDREFDAMLEAVERHDPLPDGLSNEDAADLSAARLLFAARRSVPSSLAEPAWPEELLAATAPPPSTTASRSPKLRLTRPGWFGVRWLPEVALLALIAALGALAWLGSRSLAPAQGEATPVGTPSAVGMASQVFAQWGGASYAVVADGDVAYLGVGPRVQTLDIAPDGKPKPRTVTDVLPGVVHGLDLTTDRLFVAAGTGLHMFERAANGDLVQRGDVDVGGPVQDVAVGGDTAYMAVTRSDASLATVDVSDPANPQQLGGLKLCDDIRRLAVHEQLVIAACGKYGVFVADVSDPRAPKVIGSWDREGDATDLALRWPYAYVADYRPRVLDFTDPTRPVEVDTLDDVNAEHVAVSGDRLVLAGSDGVWTYDLAADATGPHRVGGVESPDQEAPWDSVSIDGDWAVVAHGWHGGVDVFSLLDFAQPGVAGTFETLGMSRAVAASAGRAYAVDFFTDDVRAFEAEDGAHLDRFGHVLSGIQAYGVAASGTTLFTGTPWEADKSSALSVWDVADPDRPRLLGKDSGAASAGDIVALADRLAFVVESLNQMGWLSLGVVDVSNPAAPQHLGSLDSGFEQNPSDLAMADDARTVYVAESASQGDQFFSGGSGGFEAIDVSDPPHPRSVGFLATPAEALGVAAQGSYAYVAAGDSGLRVIDISHPDAPREVAVLTLPGGARDVVVDGATAFVAYSHGFENEKTSFPDYVDDFNGVVTIDVTDPLTPRIVNDLRLPGVPYQLALDRETSVGPVLWVAAEDAGLVGVKLMPAGLAK